MEEKRRELGNGAYFSRGFKKQNVKVEISGTRQQPTPQALVRFLLLYDDYYDFLGSQSKWERRRRKKEKSCFWKSRKEKRKKNKKEAEISEPLALWQHFVWALFLSFFVIFCHLSSLIRNDVEKGNEKQEGNPLSLYPPLVLLSLSFLFSFFYLSLSVN